MDVMATWKNWFDHWFFSDSTNSVQIQKIISEMIQKILSEMSLDVIFLNTPDLITFGWSVTTPTDLYWKKRLCLTRVFEQKKQET